MITTPHNFKQQRAGELMSLAEKRAHRARAGQRFEAGHKGRPAGRRRKANPIDRVESPLRLLDKQGWRARVVIHRNTHSDEYHMPHKPKRNRHVFSDEFKQSTVDLIVKEDRHCREAVHTAKILPSSRDDNDTVAGIRAT